jgi:hypothetical protein
VPQAPVNGIDAGAIDYFDSVTMASALIFLHVAFLAIDRTPTRWVSPDGTAVETLCVTRRGPLTGRYILSPNCVGLCSAIMSNSTHSPNGVRATYGTARMGATLAEHLDKQLRCPIRDAVRFCEARPPDR